MPLLYPNLRVTQVFGANTEVGKTLLTTALVRATASRYASESNKKGATGKGPSKRVFYLKPVSTGPDSESDVSYMERNVGRHRNYVAARNLYQYREPMSPHLAARLAPDLPFPKSNDELVRDVERYAAECLTALRGDRGSLFVETAGGVLSPALHPPHTQASFLRPLLLPSVLIASPHLGGISTTLSSYESLLTRGYHISAVLCLHDPYYRNDDFLSGYFADRGVPYWTIRTPPEKRGTVQEDGKRLDEWYSSIEALCGVAGEEGGGGVADAALWLDKEHDERIQELEGMPGRTLDSIWWPFTQHGIVSKKEDVMVVDSAHGDNFDAYYAKPTSTAAPDDVAPSSSDSLLKPYFDGSASWFTQSFGHANHALALAGAHAAGRYGHVLFPSGTNAPALNLAEKLLHTAGKGWADRVFYSDNGSTGIEVALKMALRASGRRYGWEGEVGGDVGVIGLRGGYHGDTIGSMDASEASTFNTAVDWYKGRGHWLSPPAVQFRDGQPVIFTTPPDEWAPVPEVMTGAEHVDGGGWAVPFKSVSDVYDLPARLSSPLAKYYRSHIRKSLEHQVRVEGKKFGALVMEPVCLGAGGMVFVDPLFQAVLVEVVRSSEDLFAPEGHSGPRLKPGDWRGLPVIYDEVFSGLHRFTYLTASSLLHHSPDIAVYAKILTGGLLPLSATLASESIFNAFLSDKKVDALLHGHSYTAHPVGCSVALEAIRSLERAEADTTWHAGKALWGVQPDVAQDTSSTPSASESNVMRNRWSFWSKDFVQAASRLSSVKGSMAMGTVCAVELEDREGGYSSLLAQNFLSELRKSVVATSPGLLSDVDTPTSSSAFAPFQIHSRPLGNVLYFMTSFYTKPEVIRGMEAVILQHLKSLQA